MRFDLTTLNLILAIEQTRSITRGAAREHLALAAASKRVADLEVRLGVSLFIRQARGVVPTEACVALVRHIRTLQSTLNAIEADVMDFTQGIRGRLRIGATHGVIAGSLPEEVAAFSRAYPNVQVSIDEMTSEAAHRALLEDEVDVGVFRLLQHDVRVESRNYRQGRLGVLVSRGHPLESFRKPAFDDLLDYDFVLQNDSDWLRDILGKKAMAKGRPLSVRFITREPDAIAQLVKSGAGIAIVPESIGARLSVSYDIKLLALSEECANYDYSLCVPRLARLPAVTQRFIDGLTQLMDKAPGLKAA